MGARLPSVPGHQGERPYLILTLRRTGGTSLMELMNAVSGFKGLQHEPLNRDRVWGAIHKDFQANGDGQAMRQALAERLETRPNIKHCYEITPLDVTKALIGLCAERNYRIFTLLRRDETARVRSLMLAMVTGAWGTEQARAIYPRIFAGEIELPPVDLDMMVRRFRADAQWTARLFAHLSSVGIAFDEILFEDLYARDGHVQERVVEIVAKLGIVISPDDARLAVFSRATGLGSERLIDFVPNAAEMEKVLAGLRDGFGPDQSV